MQNNLWSFTLISTLLLFCFRSTCIAGIFPTAELQDVKAALQDTTWVVIDTRLNHAYNGWQLDGVNRGGQFPEAVDLSANRLKVDNKKLPGMLL